jgi:hypothetical protein
MQRLVEAAGHSLAAKATAYISTYATVERLSRPVILPEQAIAALVAANGVKSDAAKNLKISRQALYRILAKYGARTDAVSTNVAPPDAASIDAALIDGVPCRSDASAVIAPVDPPAPGQMLLLNDGRD